MNALELLPLELWNEIGMSLDKSFWSNLCQAIPILGRYSLNFNTQLTVLEHFKIPIRKRYEEYGEIIAWDIERRLKKSVSDRRWSVWCKGYYRYIHVRYYSSWNGTDIDLCHGCISYSVSPIDGQITIEGVDKNRDIDECMKITDIVRTVVSEKKDPLLLWLNIYA